MAHPLHGDAVKGAAVESGYAAKKEQKYNQQMSQSGSRPSLIPLAFEHYGYWGTSAEDYLYCLPKMSKDVNGQTNEVASMIGGEGRFL